MNNSEADYELALSNCAREPIHIPGRVQSFGAVLAFDCQSEVIRYHTENLDAITGLGNDWMGAKFSDRMSEREIVHEVRGCLGLPTIGRQRERIGQYRLGDHYVDIAVHRSGNDVVLEWERDDHAVDRPSTAVSQVRSMLGWLNDRRTVDGLLESAVDVLRRTTGFDRVMAYRFLPNFEGEVVAEKRSPSLAPYLGLRYPASDIPSQVREAMIAMPFRCIADTRDEPVPLLAAADAPPLDLTLTHVKGVSPIHVEYLENMGVRSTMNLPIINRGKLWGLFALHHGRPRLISPSLRSVCELFGHLFSLELQQREESETMSRRRRAASLHQHFKDSEFDGAALSKMIAQYGNDLMELVNADGVIFAHQQEFIRIGSTPARESFEALLTGMDDEVFSFDTAIDPWQKEPVTDEDGALVAGGLATVLNSKDGTAIAFFRREEVANVRWAGHPEKRIEFGPNGPRLHPRASFDEYIESIRGRSRPWTQAEVAAATELRGVLLELIFRETKITSDQWRRQKEYQDLLIAELNHRVKNILALVRSIARQTQSSATSLNQYTESFESRIAALATAHDLIGGSGLQWASLEAMLRTELRPYSSRGEKVTLTGVPVSLKSDVAPVLSLVIHELMTNAAKHGALSVDKGELEVRWKNRGGGLELSWDEMLPGKIAPARSNGFGLSLIRRAVPHECDGETSIEFRRDGLFVRIWLPSKAVRFSGPEAGEDFGPVVEANDSRVDVHLALVVEDNMVISMEMETMLRDLGCGEVHAAGSLEEALALATHHRYGLAILDMNLSGTTSFPVAEKLQESGVPTVFVSGYGSSYSVPESLQHIQRLSKPIDKLALLATVTELLRDASA